MVEKEEIQEKILTYRILEGRLRGLMERRNTLVDKLTEIQLTQASIDEIKTEAKVLIPLGAEAHTFGKIEDSSKIIVEIGAGVAIEKNVKGAKEILEKRKEEISNLLNQIESNITNISRSLEKLTPEIEELIRKAQ